MTEQQKLQILRPLKREKACCVQMSSFCEQFLSDLSFYKNTGREREEKAGQKQVVQKQAEQKQTAQEKAGQNQAEQMQLHERVRLTNSAVENDGCLILMIS